jgi:hypothetical protein
MAVWSLGRESVVLSILPVVKWRGQAQNASNRMKEADGGLEVHFFICERSELEI